MKPVKFKDGKYGTRKYWFFGWVFLDFRDNDFAHRASTYWFKDCKTDYNTALKEYKRLTDKGSHEVVDLTPKEDWG